MQRHFTIAMRTNGCPFTLPQCIHLIQLRIRWILEFRRVSLVCVLTFVCQVSLMPSVHKRSLKDVIIVVVIWFILSCVLKLTLMLKQQQSSKKTGAVLKLTVTETETETKTEDLDPCHTKKPLQCCDQCIWISFRPLR